MLARTIRLALALSLAAAALVTAGCKSGRTGPQAACDEAVDLLADAIQRCDPSATDRAALEAEIENSSTMNQGCGRVVSLRDENELRNVCFPSIRSVSCTDLAAGRLDAACSRQLEVRTP